VLTVQNLPSVSSRRNPATSGYECIFSGDGAALHTSVTRINRLDAANTTLRCETPLAKNLPLFPAGKGTVRYITQSLEFFAVTRTATTI